MPSGPATSAGPPGSRGRLSRLLLPANQRRSLHEVTDRLYLADGDRRAKVSAFWTMIAISGVVATAGVLADSTATVIGAMIIAPLSQPMMGMAIAVVEGSTPRMLSSLVWVLGGSAVVVLLGAAAAQLLPDAADLTANSQVTARTAPSLLDLLAAVATGLAHGRRGMRRSRAYLALGAALVLVVVPLAANTVARVQQTVWTAALRGQVDAWLRQQGSDAAVRRVSIQGTSAVVELSTDRALPGTAPLLASLAGQVPRGTDVVTEAAYGVRVHVGVVDG